MTGRSEPAPGARARPPDPSPRRQGRRGMGRSCSGRVGHAAALHDERIAVAGHAAGGIVGQHELGRRLVVAARELRHLVVHEVRRPDVVRDGVAPEDLRGAPRNPTRAHERGRGGRWLALERDARGRAVGLELVAVATELRERVARARRRRLVRHGAIRDVVLDAEEVVDDRRLRALPR